MSGIKKTEAIVLSVIKYSDSSKIACLLSKDFGKISVIVKGARQKTSKEGRIIDPLNHIQALFYYKESREIQTLSGADLIDHFPSVREDFNSIKYSLAIAELTSNLTLENEIHERLFAGIAKILKRMEAKSELPVITFLRYFFFILTETGYDINLENCPTCGGGFEKMPAGFTTDRGMICNTCIGKSYSGIEISPELFSLMYCLKKGKAVIIEDETTINKVHQMLERFAAFHLEGYKPLSALKM